MRSMLMMPLLIALMLTIGCGNSSEATVGARYAELSEDEVIQLVRNHMYENASEYAKNRLLGKGSYRRLEIKYHVKQTVSHWTIRVNVSDVTWCRFTINKATHLVVETSECSLLKFFR